MSTRGLMGFVVNGEVKATYNHCDSYPGWLGLRTLRFVKDNLTRLDDLFIEVDNIRLVNADTPATDAEVAEFERLANRSVGTRDTRDWYVLLHEAQGDYYTYVQIGVMVDQQKFAQDSLFCEWAYLINLDTNEIEVYEGFQKDPHNEGRFADWQVVRHDPRGYQPVRLVHTFSFDDLPSDNDFIQILEPEEEE